MKAKRLNLLAAVAGAAFGLSMATAAATDQPVAAASFPAGPTNAAPTQIIAPQKVSLPTVPDEALRMSEAGVSDDLIVSYIQKSAIPYAIDSDQIVYLHDLGVSSAVLEALVKQSGAAAASTAPEVSNPGPASSATASDTIAQTPPVSGPAADFYSALTPYGTWLYIPAYGWCWQPTVEITDSSWLPYSDNGSWLSTDQGWYWNSYYTWGWAPFHYGRWFQDSGYGWVWCPDDVWGPAWVCWRDYPGYCGWAPLPVGANFVAGVGWTYFGVGVGFDFAFGLGPQCFTFCDYDHFCDRHPFGYFQRGHGADRFFNHSQVDNNFAVDSHNHFINRGIDPSRIETATHTRISPVSVRELPSRAGHGGQLTAPDRLIGNRNSAVIYRPGRNIASLQNPFLPGNELARVDNRANSTATRGFSTGRSIDSAPRYQPVRPNVSEQPSPRNSPAMGENLNLLNRQFWAGRNSAPAISRPAPAYQTVPSHPSAGFGFQRPVTPNRFAPAPPSAPTMRAAPSGSWSAPRTFSRPAPSFGGTPSRGGGANIGGGGMHFSGGGGSHGGGGGHGSRR